MLRNIGIFLWNSINTRPILYQINTRPVLLSEFT